MTAMTDVMNKARELGNYILDCELYKQAEKAREAFDGDMEAREILFSYNEKHRKMEELMEKGGSGGEEFKLANEEFGEALKRLEANEVIKNLINSENRLNNCFSQAVNIVKATVFGEDSCTGNCGSCGGCH